MRHSSSFVLAILLCLVVTLPALAAEANQPQNEILTDPNQVLMVFDGENITVGHFMRFRPQIDVNTAKDLTNFYLITQLYYEEAQRRGLEKEEQLKFVAEAKYKQVFVSELAERTKRQARITKEDVEKYYNENQNKDPLLTHPELFSFSQIQLADIKTAQEVLKKINAGQDINELAKELSSSKNARSGGRVLKFPENIIRNRYGDDFVNALLNASEGDVLGPIKDRQGKYQVLRHEGRRSPRPKTFDSVKKELTIKLQRDREKEALEKLTSSLKEKAKSRYKMVGPLSKNDSSEEKD